MLQKTTMGKDTAGTANTTSNVLTGVAASAAKSLQEHACLPDDFNK
jgi:hypothetical protein